MVDATQLERFPKLAFVFQPLLLVAFEIATRHNPTKSAIFHERDVPKSAVPHEPQGIQSGFVGAHGDRVRGHHAVKPRLCGWQPTCEHASRGVAPGKDTEK